MNTVRVLHFIPGFNYGGIETVFINTIKSSDPRLFQFDLLVENTYSSEQLDIARKFCANVITVSRFKALHPVKYYRQLRSILTSNRYDIVHSYNITRSWLLLLAAKRTGIAHRLFHARTSRSSDNGIKRVMYRAFIMMGIRLSTELLASSQGAGACFFGKRAYTIIKNSIDMDAFSPDDAHIAKRKKELGLQRHYVVGHVGRFTEAKNHAFLIEVFHELCQKDASARLVLIGDGPLLGAIKRKAADLGIGDKILFAGARCDLDEWYCVMDVFVFPSLYEGYGNAAVEAQAAGLPVIASSMVPKAIDLTGLVTFVSDVKNAGEWAEHILRAKGVKPEKDIRGALSESGYGMRDATKALLSYYSALVKEEK